MSDHLTSALLAVFLGGLIGVLLFVPVVAVSYRRRGRVGFWWLLGWVALFVYVVALWTYTLLPVPSAAEYRCAAPILDPLESVRDVLAWPTSSPGALLRNPGLQQLALNVALFVPLGFFTRAMFRRGAFVALFGGFLASLAIELTQLTGVWGLFPCAYRFFDVGDLITNTLGAVLGSLLALLVVRRRAEVDASAPTPVTAGRRFLGMACDLLLFVFLNAAAGIAWRGYSLVVLGLPAEQIDARGETIAAIALPLGVQLLSVLLGGVTLGERAVLLRSRRAGLPAAIGRPLRFLFGIGGYGLLLGASFPLSGALLSGFVLLSLLAVWFTPDRRGLACLLSGSAVLDRRAATAAAAGSAPVPPGPGQTRTVA